MPRECFWSVIGICLLGIVIGSFCDFDISRSLANKTELGNVFATFSPYFAYCLFPAGGTCIYAGLKKKGDSFKPLAWLLMIFSWFMAVYLSDNYFGVKVRAMLGYEAGESSMILAIVSWLVWAVMFAIIPFILIRFLDDSDPDKLIVIGAALIVATISADAIMQWLKQLGSRPRYKYLLTLDDPYSEFRNWWQMVPYLAGDNDGFLSWPSGHMSIVGVLFSLPLLTDCMKNRNSRKNTTAFILVCIFVILCGYNRIHMTNHFLSDVCFGTLNSYVLTAAICTVFRKALPKNKE